MIVGVGVASVLGVDFVVSFNGGSIALGEM